MIGLIFTWIVNTISFLILSKLPLLGIEIDNFGKAAVAAAVFGILNAILLPILTFLTNKILRKSQKQFNATGSDRFGSGWVWLVRNPQGHTALII